MEMAGLMERNQKGQETVSFAFVLPFFILLIMGVIYVGFLFADYLSLSNLARSSAREASIQASGVYDQGEDAIRSKYVVVQDKYAKHANEVQHMYIVDSSGFTIQPEGNPVEDVHVTIQARLDTSSGVAGMIGNFIPNQLQEFKIEYRMYQEHS